MRKKWLTVGSRHFHANFVEVNQAVVIALNCAVHQLIPSLTINHFDPLLNRIFIFFSIFFSGLVQTTNHEKYFSYLNNYEHVLCGLLCSSQFHSISILCITLIAVSILLRGKSFRCQLNETFN